MLLSGYRNMNLGQVSVSVSYNTIMEKALLILGIAAFIGLFQWVYISWLSPTWGYFGFGYTPPDVIYIVLANLLSIIPSIWMPVALSRPSQLIYWVLYVVVFIPSMFVPLYTALQPSASIALFMLTLFLGHALIGGSYLFPQLKYRPRPFSKKKFGILLLTLLIALTAWVLFVFKGQMRLVSFEKIYSEMRFSAIEIMEGSSVNYAIMWLSGSINPFLMSWGLAHKKKYIFFIGVLGQVLLYSTAGSKGVLLSGIVILIFYLILRFKRALFGLYIVWGCAALLLLLNLLNFVSDSKSMISSLVFMRTFGMTGLLSGLYFDFFQSHPWTYFSHVNLIGKLIDYPYQYDIGHELGGYYYNRYELNANAHFWVTDGIAGGGLVGVLIISLICAGVFWLIDSAAKGHNIIFVALLISYSAINLGNTSLFITLNSGGLGFIIIFLYMLKRDRIRSLPLSLMDCYKKARPVKSVC